MGPITFSQFHGDKIGALAKRLGLTEDSVVKILIEEALDARRYAEHKENVRSRTGTL